MGIREPIKGGLIQTGGSGKASLRKWYLSRNAMVLRKEGQKDHCKLREQDRKNGGHTAILSATPTQKVSRMVKSTAVKLERPGFQFRVWCLPFKLPCVSYKTSI